MSANNGVMNCTSSHIKQFLSIGIAVLCLAPIGAKSQSTKNSREPPIFDEVAEKIGLKFRHYNGMTGKLFLPEVMGSGVALFDFDSDGDLDVFMVQGSVLEAGDNPARTLFPWRKPEVPRGRLFRNDLTIGKDGRRLLQFTDVTEKSGIVANGYGMGVAVGDINNDGWSDLY